MILEHVILEHVILEHVILEHVILEHVILEHVILAKSILCLCHILVENLPNFVFEIRIMYSYYQVIVLIYFHVFVLGIDKNIWLLVVRVIYSRNRFLQDCRVFIKQNISTCCVIYLSALLM